MAKPYAKLRALMLEAGVDQVHLARELRRGTAYITARINAHQPWTSDEMYAMLKLFNQPAERLHEIFPENGQNEAGCHRTRPSKDRTARLCILRQA